MEMFAGLSSAKQKPEALGLEAKSLEKGKFSQ